MIKLHLPKRSTSLWYNEEGKYIVCCEWVTGHWPSLDAAKTIELTFHSERPQGIYYATVEFGVNGEDDLCYKEPFRSLRWLQPEMQRWVFANLELCKQYFVTAEKIA